MLNKCPTCDQFIQDHRYDVVVQIARSCERLRKFDEKEKETYAYYDQDNAEQYLAKMTTLHDLSEQEKKFVREF